MAWCEENRVGLARNVRLVATIEAELAAAKAGALSSGQAARRFKDFDWSARDSWSRERRVIAKAEWTQGEANPRLIITSLKRAETGARELMKTSIAPAATWRTASRNASSISMPIAPPPLPCATTNSPCFASMAYVLLCALRRIGLTETIFADAACGTIRLKLLKIGKRLAGALGSGSG